MREYENYTDEFLFKELINMSNEKHDLESALEIIPRNSVLAYLSVTASIKYLRKRINAIRLILNKRNYTDSQIDEMIK